MPRKIDLMGQRFTRLTVVGEVGRKPVGKKQVPWIVWRVRCDCGKEIECFAADLRGGNTRSCGCLQVEKVTEKNTLHGNSVRKNVTPEYRSWCHMIQRCRNPKGIDLQNYGDRGISICASWEASFQSFLDDMGPRPSSKHSIDRVNNDGNYEPGNCRWATRSEQMKNRRPPKRDARGRILPKEQK